MVALSLSRRKGFSTDRGGRTECFREGTGRDSLAHEFGDLAREALANCVVGPARIGRKIEPASAPPVAPTYHVPLQNGRPLQGGNLWLHSRAASDRRFQWPAHLFQRGDGCHLPIFMRRSASRESSFRTRTDQFVRGRDKAGHGEGRRGDCTRIPTG